MHCSSKRIKERLKCNNTDKAVVTTLFHSVLYSTLSKSMFLYMLVRIGFLIENSKHNFNTTMEWSVMSKCIINVSNIVMGIIFQSNKTIIQTTLAWLYYSSRLISNALKAITSQQVLVCVCYVIIH